MDFENSNINPIIFWSAVALDFALIVFFKFSVVIVIILTIGIIGVTYSILGFIREDAILGPIVITALSFLVVFLYWGAIEDATSKKR